MSFLWYGLLVPLGTYAGHGNMLMIAVVGTNTNSLDVCDV